MRKIISISLYFILFCSCITEKDEVTTQVKGTTKSHSEYKSISKAIEDADNAFGLFFPTTKSSREVDSAFFITNSIADTLLIVVNYDNNAGFALISAHENEPSVLGVFDRGNFQDCYKDNPGFQICYDEILANQNTLGKARTYNQDYSVESTRISTSSLGPLISVNWGQRAPFNLYATNSTTPLAGCTPIAIAQAMSYFEYPNGLSITYTDTTATQITLRWRELKAHSNDTYCTPLCETCKALSHLLREIGHRCNANYNPSSTGAWPYAEYLSKFRYQCKQSTSFNLDDIEEYIWDYRLALLCGFNSSGTVGHTWVVDGIRNIKYKNRYYLENPDGSETDAYIENCKDTYLHFNFGWYGSGNGFILCETEVECNGTTTYPKTIFSGTYTDIRLQISNLRTNAAREI